MKSWSLEDPTPIAKEFKYTFYIPPKSVIEQLRVGNYVKLIFQFESDDPEAPGGERMWVIIKEIRGKKFIGTLDNEPMYIKDLKIGEEIEFESKHIITCDIANEEENLVEKYIHRCLVTKEISQQKRKVKYFYREESMGELDNGKQDSGWRILAGDESQEYMDDANNSDFLSLGLVLNIDDSIIEYLDAPVGSEFVWDELLEKFIEVS